MVNAAVRMFQPCFTLGIDVGGSKIAAGVVQFPDGKVVLQGTVPTHADHPAGVLGRIRDLALSLRKQAAGQGAAPIATGLALCELVSPDGQILSHNRLSFSASDAHEQLKPLGSLILEADVRAAALAEARFGAGRSRQHFVYLTVGTGIASCLVVGGVPYLGARGASGTLASSPVGIRCSVCDTVEQRTLEQMASGPGLVAQYNRLTRASFTSGQQVLEAAAQGDTVADSVVAAAADALGVFAGLTINVLDPEVLIVGGGLGLAGGRFWDCLLRSTRRHIWSDTHRELPIVRAETGSQAGVIGAAAAALEPSSRPAQVTS